MCSYNPLMDMLQPAHSSARYDHMEMKQAPRIVACMCLKLAVHMRASRDRYRAPPAGGSCDEDGGVGGLGGLKLADLHD